MGIEQIVPELVRIQNAKANLKTSINAKGGTLDTETLDDYASAVDALSGGGGVAAGVSWDAFNVNGYVTAASVYGTVVPLYSFYSTETSGFYRFLVSVNLPDNLTAIGVNAFADCVKLALTSLPSGITSIGARAFYRCTKLALTSLPSGITSIGASMFAYCTNLALTSLPSGITSIGGTAFFYCTSLRKIWIPSACTDITAASTTSTPFYGCSSSLVIYCEAESKPAGWGEYWNYVLAYKQLTVAWGVTKAAFDAL